MLCMQSSFTFAYSASPRHKISPFLNFYQEGAIDKINTLDMHCKIILDVFNIYCFPYLVSPIFVVYK